MSLKVSSLKIQRIVLQAQRLAARTLAKSIPQMIKERVLSGFGLKGKLDALSESYIKTRTRLKRYLSKKTSPTTSNLSATGQLVNSITGQSEGTIVRVFISDKKRRTNPLSPGNQTNKEIRKYVEDGGREFLGLTNQEKSLIIAEAKEIIAQEIRKRLKN